MIIAWLLAFVHLLALGIGLGAVWTRARVLSGALDRDRLEQVFMADTLWGVAAALWIATGLVRAFGGIEKGAAYYLHSSAFHAKMALLAAVLILEVWPMVTLIGWRIRHKRAEPIDFGKSRALARVSYAQAALVVLMVLAATAMARGIGA
ncbi:MAG: DUF2214 family protein [Gammaproteobacteria bacterium]